MILPNKSTSSFEIFIWVPSLRLRPGVAYDAGWIRFGVIVEEEDYKKDVILKIEPSNQREISRNWKEIYWSFMGRRISQVSADSSIQTNKQKPS